MTRKVQSHPPFADVIDASLFLNYCTYIPEPPIEDGRRKLCYHASLISYSIAGTVHEPIGPLPKCIKKPHTLKDCFPTFPSYGPLVFVDVPFDFNFFKNKVFCYSPLIGDTDYIKWLGMGQENKKHFWRYLSIFDIIQLSQVGPKYNSHMLIARGEKTGHGPCTCQKMAGWVGILCPLIRSVNPALRPLKKERIGALTRQPSYQALKVFILVSWRLILEI